MSSGTFRFGRAIAAIGERLRRWDRVRATGASDARDIVGVGSIVRAFSVDTLREFRLILAPDGWPTATPGLVPADSPLGAALVGGRPGEMRRWRSPTEMKRAQIIQILGRVPERVWARAAGRIANRRPVPSEPFRTAPPSRPAVVPAVAQETHVATEDV